MSREEVLALVAGQAAPIEALTARLDALKSRVGELESENAMLSGVWS
jgi:hypothetical protein